MLCPATPGRNHGGRTYRRGTRRPFCDAPVIDPAASPGAQGQRLRVTGYLAIRDSELPPRLAVCGRSTHLHCSIACEYVKSKPAQVPGAESTGGGACATRLPRVRAALSSLGRWGLNRHSGFVIGHCRTPRAGGSLCLRGVVGSVTLGACAVRSASAARERPGRPGRGLPHWNL